VYSYTRQCADSIRITDIGSALFMTGLLGVALQYVDG